MAAIILRKRRHWVLFTKGLSEHVCCHSVPLETITRMGLFLNVVHLKNFCSLSLFHCRWPMTPNVFARYLTNGSLFFISVVVTVNGIEEYTRNFKNGRQHI